jgi:hypothetical protein
MNVTLRVLELLDLVLPVDIVGTPVYPEVLIPPIVQEVV